jgi:hypothetical protein
MLTWAAAAALLLFVLGGWMWIRTRHSFEPNDTAVLDLRERSASRGQNSSDTHPPLEIPRSAKHLVLDLPIGSREELYDVAVFTSTNEQILSATGMAQLHNHVTDVRVEVDLSRVRPGAYSLGVRPRKLEWTLYPMRIF